MPLFTMKDGAVLIGDGVKQAKEARYMPGVKKLHQESENSSKAEYIFGHMFGVVGVMVGNINQWFCLSLFINLQDGVSTIFRQKDCLERQDSHVVQTVENAFKITKVIVKYTYFSIHNFVEATHGTIMTIAHFTVRNVLLLIAKELAVLKKQNLIKSVLAAENLLKQEISVICAKIFTRLEEKINRVGIE